MRGELRHFPGPRRLALAVGGERRRAHPDALAADAFREYRLGGANLSATAMAVVRRMLAGEAVEQETSGLSKREWRELMGLIGRI